MKKCPKCGKMYDDSWGVCIDCQVPLQNLNNTEGKCVVTSLGHRSKRDPKEFIGNIEKFKVQIKARHLKGKLAIASLVFTASVLVIAGILAYQDEIAIPDFVYILLIVIFSAGFFTFSKLFYNSAEKNPSFLSSADKRDLVRKAIAGWYNRGVIISKPIEHYQESFSRVNAIFLENPFCFYDVRIGLEALKAQDFIEEGLSLEETISKWGPFFDSLIKNNGKDFLKG